jgi:hypothetical protein
MVFSKVGASELLTIASISAFAEAIPSWKAGRKSSFLIWENGAVSYLVWNFWVSMFILLAKAQRRKVFMLMKLVLGFQLAIAPIERKILL